MKRDDKYKIIEDLTQRVNDSKSFYIADTSHLNAVDTGLLRRKCFERDIKLIVVKNTLFKKALENSNLEVSNLYDVLKDSTSVMFCEESNVPAKLIKEFRKTREKPLLKAAYIEESIYIGDNQLDILSSLKSKEELIGDIILLLQSPMKNVVSSLKSGNNILTGVLKTLGDKKE